MQRGSETRIFGHGSVESGGDDLTSLRMADIGRRRCGVAAVRGVAINCSDDPRVQPPVSSALPQLVRTSSGEAGG